jgi:DUF4097 and DUF4098 domain-containing protein YvlB
METMTFATPGPTRFSIELHAGDIRVETSDVATTTIDIVARRGPDPEVTQSDGPEDGSTISIRSRKAKRQETGVTIRCPEGASFDVSTGSADLAIRGEVGDVDFRAGSGDMVFERARGDVSVKVGSGDALGDVVGGAFTMQSGSGDARVREVGTDITVKTASGDITTGPVGGDAHIATVSGDVRIGSLRTGDARLRSVSGDVEVGVVAGTHVFLDLSATSGEARSELEPSGDPGGAGTLELHVATVSGDITIKRA